MSDLLITLSYYSWLAFAGSLALLIINVYTPTRVQEYTEQPLVNLTASCFTMALSITAGRLLAQYLPLLFS